MNEENTDSIFLKELKNEQEILGRNAWYLGRYFIEHDYKIDFPNKEDKFDLGKFIVLAEQYPNLEDSDKQIFVNQYAILEKATKSVTARTLFATRIHGQGFLYATFGTSVGKYLLFLGVVTLTIIYFLISLIITDNADKYSIFIPFLAAGLGTCVFLLRVTQEKLSTREFDPAFIPSQLIRLCLGVLAGGSIVFFPDLFNPNESSSTSSVVTMGQGALAFIFGYAIDIFYSILDNIGGRVKDRNI